MSYPESALVETPAGRSPLLSDDPEFKQLHTEVWAHASSLSHMERRVKAAEDELRVLRWNDANRTEFTKMMRRVMSWVLGLSLGLLLATFFPSVPGWEAIRDLRPYAFSFSLACIAIWLTA